MDPPFMRFGCLESSKSLDLYGCGVCRSCLSGFHALADFLRLQIGAKARLEAPNGTASVPDLTTFRINTCKSVSKQRTLTTFRINTCEKPRGEGAPRFRFRQPHPAVSPPSSPPHRRTLASA